MHAQTRNSLLWPAFTLSPNQRHRSGQNRPILTQRIGGNPSPAPAAAQAGQTPTLLENRFAFVPEGEELMLKNNASFHPRILHKQCVCSKVLQVSHVTSLAYPCRRSYARNKPQRRFRWRGMSAIKIPRARTRKQQTQPVTARSFNTLST